MEAAAIADNVACLVEVLEQVSSQAPLPNDDDDDSDGEDDDPSAGNLNNKSFAEVNGELVQRVLYGDSAAAIALPHCLMGLGEQDTYV